ncbi:MAG: hypothetical protein ACF8CY_02395 [Gimesia chilikensis]
MRKPVSSKEVTPEYLRVLSDKHREEVVAGEIFSVGGQLLEAARDLRKSLTYRHHDRSVIEEVQQHYANNKFKTDLSYQDGIGELVFEW